jgi:hypothetical protein
MPSRWPARGHARETLRGPAPATTGAEMISTNLANARIYFAFDAWTTARTGATMIVR